MQKESAKLSTIIEDIALWVRSSHTSLCFFSCSLLTEVHLFDLVKQSLLIEFSRRRMGLCNIQHRPVITEVQNRTTSNSWVVQTQSWFYYR
jgi:uncharacterized membrane protein